jgi:hypothetical protein
LKFSRQDPDFLLPRSEQDCASSENHRFMRVSMFEKKIIDMLVDQVWAIIYETMVTPVMNCVISRAIASLLTTA